MLATRWQGQDPTGWLMSEKMDGIRMIRPKGSKVIVSREGNPFYPPAWWTAQLPPDIYLDGEAWCGRGMFQQTQRILQRPEPYDHEPWTRIKFMVIEPWSYPGLSTDKFGRSTWLSSTGQQSSVAFPILQHVCQNREHLQEFYDEIVEAGGEGVMLRHPNQPYHCGRSPYLLRVKPEFKGVAFVAQHNKDEHGNLVSLRLNWNVGLCSFDVSNGLTQAIRVDPPAIGAKINFLYQCTTDSGKPRFAKLAKKI
jgi:DNA ligase 1